MNTQQPSAKGPKTVASLIALGAGILLGSLIHGSSSPILHGLSSVIEPIGIVWTRALQMLVVPLVVFNLIDDVLYGVLDPRIRYD